MKKKKKIQTIEFANHGTVNRYADFYKLSRGCSARGSPKYTLF